MTRWLTTRPLISAYLFAAACYLLMLGLFRTPALRGDGAMLVWWLLLAVWIAAAVAGWKAGWRGILPAAALVVVAGYAWFVTGFGLACAAYGDCL